MNAHAFVAALATLALATPVAAEHESEIALALEAAPPSVQKGAGVWVHGKSGYIKVRESQNGFVCVADHRIPAAVEPQCMDGEGVRTFFPKMQLVASLRAQGKSEPEITQAIKEAFASGKLIAPKRAGVIYMLSPHNVVTIDEDKGIVRAVPPHLMFYAPGLTAADVGGGSPDSPIIVADEGSPHALMIVMQPKAEPHQH
jgi:hypothetical protein